MKLDIDAADGARNWLTLALHIITLFVSLALTGWIAWLLDALGSRLFVGGLFVILELVLVTLVFAVMPAVLESREAKRDAHK